MPSRKQKSRIKTAGDREPSQDRCYRHIRKPIIPSNKTKKRFEYGNGTGNRLPNTRKPRHLNNVQSKIKDHVAYFKAMAKDSSNRPMFNKDPIIYAKDPNAEEDIQPVKS